MYKAGDKFVIVESAYLGDYWKAGNIVEFVKPYEDLDGVYSFKAPGRADDYFLNFCIAGETHFHSTVRPLRTEAEKRGAKFGVGGVAKETGERVVFNSVREKVNHFTGEEVWVVICEGIPDKTIGIEASNVRLDHEPEYKEIPFSEATHEQRMDVSRVCNKAGKNPTEALYTAGGFYVYTFEENTGPTMVNGKQTHTTNLIIRIPT